MKYLYYIIYTVYLLVMILYGDTMESTIPVPVLASAGIMTIVVLFEKNFFLDIYFKIYLVFVFCYIISEVVTGYSTWIPRFTAYYAECYCAYAATLTLVRKFRGTKFLAAILICIGMIDAIVTIGQAYENPLAERIMFVLNVEKSLDLEMMQDAGKDLMGNYIPGIFTIVKNGFFLLMTTVLTLHLQNRPFSILSCIGLFVSLTALYATFLTQERSAFLLASFFVVVITNKIFVGSHNSMKPVLWLLFVIIVSWAVVEVSQAIMQGDNRFTSTVVKNDSRFDIYHKAFDFILQNPIVGGHGLYFDTMRKAPHNLLLNAYVYGGLGGFIAIVVLCYRQWKLVLKMVWKKVSEENLSCICFGLAFLAYNLHGMTHNSSLVTGDIMLWVLWAGFIVQYQNLRKLTKIK